MKVCRVYRVFAFAAALACAACVAPPAEVSADQSFQGTANDAAFVTRGGRTRAANSSGGVAIELADSPFSCDDNLASLPALARVVTLGIDETVEPGVYEVGGVGSPNWAVLTTYERDTNGAQVPSTLLLSSGTIRVDAVGERVTGSAEVGAADAASFHGTFDVPDCR